MKTKEQIEELARIYVGYPINKHIDWEEERYYASDKVKRYEDYIRIYTGCQYHLKQELEEKTKQEAVKFADWLKNECYNYHISFNTYIWRKLDDDITSYTSEEIYELFLK